MTTPQGKTPWYHRRSDGKPCFFAVIWERWSTEHEHLESCVVLTQAANDDCRDVHDRMPVILDTDAVSPWLDHGALPAGLSSGTVDRHPVGRAVNKASEPSGMIRLTIPGSCSIRNTVCGSVLTFRMWGSRIEGAVLHSFVVVSIGVMHPGVGCRPATASTSQALGEAFVSPFCRREPTDPWRR